MSFTKSNFTFINCEDPSKRFTLSNDEIRQMELKINVAKQRSGNWEHIGNHLYNFHSKIGVIGQPKSNRNVYPAEYEELLTLKDMSYRDVLEAQPSKIIQSDMPKVDEKVEHHLKRQEGWENYTANFVSNTDDSINNPSFQVSDYSNNLAMQMMKKLNVDTSTEYVSSAQLHMKDRFRRDILDSSDSSSASDVSDFEDAEARVKLQRKNATSEDVENNTQRRKKQKIKRKNATSEDVENNNGAPQLRRFNALGQETDNNGYPIDEDDEDDEASDDDYFNS